LYALGIRYIYININKNVRVGQLAAG